MRREPLIFTPGIWLGEGLIRLGSSSESVKFYTKWQITQTNETVIKAIQVVEMQGIEDRTTNYYTFNDFQKETFSVILENDLVGYVSGLGSQNQTMFGWEFRDSPSFEGFENYLPEDSGTLAFKAEYGSQGFFRTLIQGKIWRKNF